MHPKFQYAPRRQSIRENLFETLTNFDVFFYIEYPEGTSEEMMAHKTAEYCNLLRPSSGNNKITCQSRVEIPQRADENSVVWSNFFHAGHDAYIKGFLHQLYGLYRVNTMRKDFEQKTATTYAYLIRLRPDVGVFKPFPSLATLDFGTKTTPRVLIASKSCCCGNEDWFGVGQTEAMNRYFDRYLYLQAAEHDWHEDFGFGWTAEHFAQVFLSKQLNATLTHHPDIFTCVVKPIDRSVGSEWGVEFVPSPPPPPPPLPPSPLRPTTPSLSPPLEMQG